MYILGFDCYGHDAAAALLKDGKLIAFAEEERFVRKKHTPEYPLNAIQWCCEHAGIQPTDLDHIVYYWNPYLGLPKRLGHFLRFFPRSLPLIASRSEKFFPMLRIKKTTRKLLALTDRTKIHFAEHHLLHAASAFFPSPYQEAAIMSIDAVGEWTTTWLGYGQDNRLYCEKKIDFPHSLGIVYGGITEHLGFKFASGEGKVMGLAPYGDPASFIDIFRKIIRLTPQGGFDLDLSYFSFHQKGRPHWVSRKFCNQMGPPRTPEAEITQQHKDIAAALQLRTEEVCLHMAEWLHRKTSLNKLCLAGGVCLNSVMNGRLLEQGLFENIWIQPAANDTGTSLGGALWLWNQKMQNPRTFIMEHAYYGPAYSEQEILKAVADNRLTAEAVADPAREAAALVAEGKIVAWFQGRMECGPRALGNRSILADPRDPAMKDILNSRVKFRESFRPFAPSVPVEKSEVYFNSKHPSPYMIMVYSVKPEKTSDIPAITHVDGTARVQTVDRRYNPAYYDLITNFGKLTGVYCILNTSFNIRGQPIVNRPEEAIECYLKTGIDALFIGKYKLQKNV